MSRPNVIDLAINDGIYLQRLIRNTEKLAHKVGVNPDVLVAFVNGCQGKCAICQSGFAKPYIFIGPLDDERFGVRAIICGTCNAAIAKCRKDPERYRKHRRFNPVRLDSRARLGRLITLSHAPIAIRDP